MRGGLEFELEDRARAVARSAVGREHVIERADGAGLGRVERLAHDLGDLEETDAAVEERLPGLAGADDTTRSEFYDIVSWLPQFAADTDLSRREWDRVQAAAATLAAVADGTDADTVAAVETLREVVTALPADTVVEVL